MAVNIRSRDDDDDDEITNYLNARYLGASEAVYRIFKFELSSKFPAVERLAVHLPDEQLVYYDPDNHAAAKAIVSPYTEGRDSTLTGWFKANKLLLDEAESAGHDVDKELLLPYISFVRRWVCPCCCAAAIRSP